MSSPDPYEYTRNMGIGLDGPYFPSAIKKKNNSMDKLEVIIRPTPSLLEETVNSFLERRHLVSGNFQRNVFYKRLEDGSFSCDPIETFTAFIVWRS